MQFLKHEKNVFWAKGELIHSIFIKDTEISISKKLYKSLTVGDKALVYILLEESSL